MAGASVRRGWGILSGGDWEGVGVGVGVCACNRGTWMHPYLPGGRAAHFWFSALFPISKIVFSRFSPPSISKPVQDREPNAWLSLWMTWSRKTMYRGVDLHTRSPCHQHGPCCKVVAVTNNP